MKLATKTITDVIIISVITVVLTLAIWLPHLLNLSDFFGLNFSAGFNTIYRNYDGLEYIVIAKSFYQPSLISSLPYTLNPIYYASHFPGYSVLILFFAPLLGFLKSMLFVSVFSTILAAITFYFLVKDFKLTTQPLFLSLLFLILPARWLIVHSVGSAEPTFIFFTLLAIYFWLKFDQFKKTQFVLLVALAGLAAQLTRPPGILLFLAVVVYIIYNLYNHYNDYSYDKSLKYLPLAIIPLGLLVVFFIFGQSYGDFLAYFHSGDNIHLKSPFAVFNKNEFWVGEIWLEDIIYVLILGFLGALLLFKERLYLMSFYVFVYLAAITLVAHRDISRYALPIFPFLLIAFQKVLVSKEFRVVLIIVALAIYLYAQNFILGNSAPIPNLTAFN